MGWALGAWLVCLGAVSFAALRTPAPAGRVLRVERSAYRTLYVVEDGTHHWRCLTFGKADGRQSCVDPAHPERLLFDYTRATLGVLYLNPHPQRVLIVGLGGGVMPRAFRQAVPGVAVDAVEIDPAVVAAARRDFGYRDGDGVATHIQDARVFVRAQAKAGVRYDIVVLDAFDKDYIPEHLLTQEFLTQVRQVLAPGGAIAANTFARSALRAHEQATYQVVFGPLLEIAVDSGNRILLARPDGLPEPSTVNARAKEMDSRLAPLDTSSAFLLPRLHPLETATARPLTDQYSPSNLLQTR